MRLEMILPVGTLGIAHQVRTGQRHMVLKTDSLSLDCSKDSVLEVGRKNKGLRNTDFRNKG